MQTITRHLFSRKALFIDLFIILFSTLCFAQNPFVTGIYTADPSGHVWADGRLYVYASHDVDPNQGCDLMDRYHVYSTSDMVNWVDEGEILNSSQVPWSTEPGFMWAPDCAYKNGTYYFYFPHPSNSDWNNSWKIGVATSTNPARGFTCLSAPIAGLGGSGMIDPAVFVDDDGQAYIYYGGGGMCQGCKLNNDMISLNGTPQNMTGLSDMHEATWVHKYNGLYYLTYADNTSPQNQMRYATSTNPLGPWTYRGIYLTPVASACTHGSVVQFKGQWYQFYFNSAISGNDWLRSICVDRLFYNADGTIQTVTQTTAGVPAAGPTSTPVPVLAKYEAENAVLGNGATLATDSAASGGKSVQNLQNVNSYVQFNNVNGANSGRATVNIYYAANALTKLRLTVNSTDYSFVNTLTTGGMSNYSGHAYFTVVLNAGTTNTIKLTGGNGSVNLDYITITSFNDPVGTPTPSPTPTPTPIPTPTVPPGMTKYEAENGALANGATVGTDAAASGGKCVQNMHLVNSSCQIGSVNGGTGGSGSLYIFYATSDATPSLAITVNGISAGTITCPSTGGWSNYSGYVVKTITLSSGTNNTIKLTGGNGGVNLDYIGFALTTGTGTPTPTPTPGATKYEAESGTVGNGAIVANDSAASGGKCIQNLHLAGAYFQIGNINGGSGGSKTLHIIYAASGTGTVTVYVNGTSTGTLSFPTTGGWSAFTGNVQKTITLNSGTGNTIQIVGGSGGINPDYITIQ